MKELTRENKTEEMSQPGTRIRVTYPGRQYREGPDYQPREIFIPKGGRTIEGSWDDELASLGICHVTYSPQFTWVRLRRGTEGVVLDPSGVEIVQVRAEGTDEPSSTRIVGDRCTLRIENNGIRVDITNFRDPQWDWVGKNLDTLIERARL